MSSREVSPSDVGSAYFEMHHQLHRYTERAMSAGGQTLGRSKVLMRLHLEGSMNQARLAGLLGFAPRSVTDTIDALERDGLVVRTECETDRRARILSLTPAGVEAAEGAMKLRSKAMTEIFGGLSASDRATFVDLITAIRTNLPTGDCSGNNN